MEAEKSIAYFCAECGSPSVEFSVIAGGNATCKACGWCGPREKLAAHAFSHDHGSDQQTLVACLNELRAVMGDAAAKYAVYLRKLGFWDGSNPKQLARLLAAMTQASFKALVETKQEMEKERVNGS